MEEMVAEKSFLVRKSGYVAGFVGEASAPAEFVEGNEIPRFSFLNVDTC
jgi:hypothetical protein